MFLIVAIILAYLGKTGREHLKKPVYAGVAIAALVSLTTAWHIADLAQDPIMEGGMAIIAGFMVATMTYTVMRAAKNMRQHINDRLEISAQKIGWSAVAGIFIFTFLMIVREGMETAMMLGAMTGSITIANLLAGGLIGFSAVGVIGYAWIKNTKRINLRIFMQATGLFLMLFCVHLFMYGVYELTEIGALPFVDNFKWHTLTETFKPGEPVGDLMTIGLLAVPCMWLAYSYAWDKYVQPRVPAFNR
jgi:high-affinity iron transporter